MEADHYPGYKTLRQEDVMLLFKDQPYSGLEAERGSFLRAQMRKAGVVRGQSFNLSIAKFTTGEHLLYFRDQAANFSHFYMREADWQAVQRLIQLHYWNPRETFLFQNWPRADRSSYSAIEISIVRDQIKHNRAWMDLVRGKNIIPLPYLLKLLPSPHPQDALEDLMDAVSVKRGCDFVGPIGEFNTGAKLAYVRAGSNSKFEFWGMPEQTAGIHAFVTFNGVRNDAGIAIVL